MTLVDKHLLNAALAERDAAREENARLRAALERIRRAALAVPTADDGAERGAR